MIKRFILGFVAIGAASAISLGSHDAAAQSVSDFYKGKTLTFLVPYPPGGSYDAYARMVQAHMKKYIPGAPNIIVQNMGGGGGSKGTNYFVRSAPKDGTMVLFPPDAYAISPALQPKRAKHNPTKLISLGSIVPVNPVFMVRGDAKAKSIKNLQKTEIVVGCTGRSSQSFINAAVLKHMIGFKWKIICGYKGSAALTLALKRGEIHAQSSAWISWRIREAALIKSGELIPTVQVGLSRDKELPKVPLMQELTKDKKIKRAIEFISTGSAIGRSIVALGGTPKARVAALRKAFDQVVKDKAFLADVAKRKALVQPTSGAKIQKIVAAAQSVPKDIVAIAKASQKLKAGKCKVNCTKKKKKK